MTAISSQKEIDHGFTILDQILAPANAQLYLPFLDKVDPIKLQLPDYDKYVKEPMWLRKIQSKFHNQTYESIKEFVCDFRLMLLNCYRYNGVTSRLGRVAEKLELLFEQKLNLLPSEIKAKTTIQATICGFSPEEELIDSSDLPSKRRNTTRLIPATNSIGRSAPIRTLMEEFERSKRDGLFFSLLGEEIDTDPNSLNEDEGVSLIVNRLNSWQRKRHDHNLIATWPEFWSTEYRQAQSRLNQLKSMSEFFEVYQLVFSLDEVIGISDILSATTLSREIKALTSSNSQSMILSNVSSLFFQHRRLLCITELELAFSVDVTKSLLLSIIFHSLLILTSSSKEVSELLNALEKYRSFKDAVLSNSVKSNTSDYKGGSIVKILGSLVPEDYEKWHERLKERIESWYTTLSYTKSSNKNSNWIWRKIGVMNKFFRIFGDSGNPLETKKFHEFSLYQQVFLTKTLLENILRTNAKIRTNLDRVVDWSEIREQVLGCDPTENTVYFHIPGIFSYSPISSIRIYKMEKFDEAKWNPDAFIESLNLAVPSNQAQIVEETLLFNPKDDSIENSFYFVPGPIFHLPKWIPEHLAGYVQKRWLSLLNTQVLLQQDVLAEKQAGDKKGQGPKAQELKRFLASGCKWLPMGSMEALYAAEGKNHLGKYTGGQRTKTAHTKRQETHEQKVKSLFVEEPIMMQSDYYRLRAPQNAPYPPGMHNKIKALCSGRLDLVFNENSDEESLPTEDEEEEDEGKIAKSVDKKVKSDEEDSQQTTVQIIPAQGNDDESTTQSSEDAYNHFVGRNAISEEMGGLKLKIKLSPYKGDQEKIVPELTSSPKKKDPEEVCERMKEESATSCHNPDTPSTEPCEGDRTLMVESVPGDLNTKNDYSDFTHSIIMPNEGKFSLVADNLTSLLELVDTLNQKLEKMPDDDTLVETGDVSDSDHLVESPLLNSKKRKSRRPDPETPISKKMKRNEKPTVEEYIPELKAPKRNISQLVTALTTIIVEHQDEKNSREIARVDAEKLMRLRFRKDFEQLEKLSNQEDSPAMPERITQENLSAISAMVPKESTNQTIIPVTKTQTNGALIINQPIIMNTIPNAISSHVPKLLLPSVVVSHPQQQIPTGPTRQMAKRQTRLRQSIKPPTYLEKDNDDDDDSVTKNSEEEGENHEDRPVVRTSARRPRKSLKHNEDTDYYQDDEEEDDDQMDSDYSDDWQEEDDDRRDGSYAPSMSRGKPRGSHSNRKPSHYADKDYSNVQYIANRPLVPIAPKPVGRPIPLFVAAQRTSINGQPTTVINSKFPIVTPDPSGVLRPISTTVGFNPRQVITSSNGTPLTLVQTTVRPPLVNQAPVQPSKNIFRIKDMLFTEDMRPVKVVEGKLVPCPMETVPADILAEAKAMIIKYKANATIVNKPSSNSNGKSLANGISEKCSNGSDTKSNEARPMKTEDNGTPKIDPQMAPSNSSDEVNENIEPSTKTAPSTQTASLKLGENNNSLEIKVTNSNDSLKLEDEVLPPATTSTTSNNKNGSLQLPISTSSTV